MSNKKEKTVIRTIRITKEMDKLLQNDAKTKRISVNSLVSMIMTRYAEMDRFNEKFGTITLRRESFKAILEELTEDKILKIAKEMGSVIPREFLLFWFKNVTLDSYLKYLSLICRYSGFGEYEVASDERSYSLTVIHDMGYKWSIFLENLIVHGMKSTIGISPKTDVTKNSLVVRFHKNYDLISSEDI